MNFRRPARQHRDYARRPAWATPLPDITAWQPRRFPPRHVVAVWAVYALSALLLLVLIVQLSFAVSLLLS